MSASKFWVVMTRWLMTCTRWSAKEVTAERTRSCGISCCSINMVAPAW